MEIPFGIRRGCDKDFSMTSTRSLFSALAIALTFTGCSAPPEESETAPVGPSVLPDAVIAEALRGPVDFNKHVRPILEQNCVACHDGTQMVPGYMNLTNREATLNDGPFGPRIVPGAPDKSLLIKNLAALHAPVRTMPPVGNRLTDDEKKILRNWISAGAPWPAGPAGRLRRR